MDPLQEPEQSYEIGSVPPPLCRLCGYFFGSGLLDFSEFWHGARSPYEVVYDRARFVWKNFFAPKLRKWAKNRPNIKKNLIINFHIICSVLKIYIICCVPAQIL